MLNCITCCIACQLKLIRHLCNDDCSTAFQIISEWNEKQGGEFDNDARRESN